MNPNRNRLIGTSDYASQRGYQMDEGVYDPSGQPVYGNDGSKIGSVHSALVEEDSGKIRYLVVNTGGWFNNKSVLVPVGMARYEEDGVYLDNLTKDQVGNMKPYREGAEIKSEDQHHDDAVIRGREPASAATSDRFDYRDNDKNDKMFETPNRLQLLEERLTVDKRRDRVGSVEVGKRVESRQENVNVDLSHDEVVIERRPVTDGRAVDGAKLGADAGAIRVDLEAERADVRKQAFVAEEVEVSKRDVSEKQTFTESVGRERIEIEREGDVRVRGDEANLDKKLDNKR